MKKKLPWSVDQGFFCVLLPCTEELASTQNFYKFELRSYTVGLILRRDVFGAWYSKNSPRFWRASYGAFSNLSLDYACGVIRTEGER